MEPESTRPRNSAFEEVDLKSGSVNVNKPELDTNHDGVLDDLVELPN